MFYTVFYYDINLNGNAVIMNGGFYQEYKDAKMRLEKLIPNSKDHINNTIKNNNRIGWINIYDFGDCQIENNSLVKPNKSLSF